MLLKKLIQQVDVLAVHESAADFSKIKITALSYDSREVVPGALFFSLHSLSKKISSKETSLFVTHAIEQGAVAIVAEEPIKGVSVPVILVANVRSAMADIAGTFYHHPSHSLACCGVTGTNGKTTTTYLLRHLCEASGRASGLIGTVEYILPGEKKEASRTTPESVDLQKMMRVMKDGGFKAVTMEVSSHAIVQERVRGTAFDAAIFTNLTQDHLDYHGSMEAYFQAKASLFIKLSEQKEKCGKAIINSDDRYGRLLMDKLPNNVPTLTFGQSSNADFRASDIRHTTTGTTFRLDARGRSYLVRSPLIGLFNVYNALGALAASVSMGLELRRAIKALATAPQIPGRLERVSHQTNFQVFIDYAHTPDALENAVKSLRQLEPSRLIVLFGCGGNRDGAKRPLMASAAEKHADIVILTTDNPRNEKPEMIIAEAKRGFKKKNYHCIIDREEAINYAIEQARPNDIVVIAGKGHEKYQEVNGICASFDDVVIAKRAISKKSSSF